MIKGDTVGQQEIWYIYVNEQTRGPMGSRDLDVLLRTNEINSRTFCWRNGMKQWKPMMEIEELKQNILDSSNQILQIQKKTGTGEPVVEVTKPNAERNNAVPEGEGEEDHMIENKDENPLTILEVTVDNLLKKTFQRTEEGKWRVYDQEKQQWVLQDEQPVDKMTQMKTVLLNKLKTEFFSDQKNRRKFKHPAHVQPQQQKPLTKQQLQKKQRNKKKTKRASEKKKQKWYQAKINTFVYVSGLPFDISEDELKQFASKAGVLRIDLSTGKEKIKIYKDENGLPKGDAAVSYAREESVEIALEMLNDSQIRDGFKVRVEKAQFNQKDQEYKKRNTKKQTKVKKILAKKNEDKQFGWQDENEQKGEGFRIVIMKYVFTIDQANNEAQMSEIKADIAAELGKIGEVKRLRFFQTHPDGVVEIKFDKDIDAQKCIETMNGRFFDGREILCEYWDGQTDYKLDAKSIALQQERLLKYGDQIEKDEQKKQHKLPQIVEQRDQDDGAQN